MLQLIVGGARSGKSRYAASLAGEAQATYVATAMRSDDTDFMARIARHREGRPASWVTVEEPRDPGRAALEAATPYVIVDCATLWLTNLVLTRPPVCDEEIERAIDAGIARFAQAGSVREVIVVTNEVGGGVVPVEALARRFVDLQGRANQRLAQTAQRVVLMVAGIPVEVKP
ncbi:bifunctional adenosylcobinamide kinase/adenosylcobinamide-phosphate guanylyltransferase [bacterium]|nr:MAG: bifunctional adenosylcobinamide kinase/adenosylcobinamide-phosphate guanylyltransferase [bacterium]